MSVEVDAPYYKMDHKKRGICFIVNNEKFSVPKLDDRKGTSKDRDGLESVFKGLGFDVKIKENLTCSATLRKLKKVAEKDHTNHDCLVICVLSHGEEGVIYATDEPFKIEQLLNPFTADNCPTLASKPKLFFLQACQGKETDSGITISSRVDRSPEVYKIPVHADFLIAYSTLPGYLSWRNETGSWFIQALVAELRESGTKNDILTILTFVNRRVAFDHVSNCVDDPFITGKKIVPYITFMLTRLVKFSLPNSDP